MLNKNLSNTASTMVALAFLLFAGRARAEPPTTEFPAPPSILADKPFEPSRDDDEVHKVLKALYNERLALTAAHYKMFAAGAEPNIDVLLAAARRLLAVGMELQPKPEQKIALLTKMQEFSFKVERLLEYYKTFKRMPLEAQKLREFKLEVERDLLRAKKKVGKDK